MGTFSRIGPPEIATVSPYRRYVACQVDRGGRPLRTVLLHHDEPHDQDDTPENLVLVALPPSLVDPRWNAEKNYWHEGSKMENAWRVMRNLIVPLLLALLFSTFASAQGLGGGGLSGAPVNAAMLNGRLLCAIPAPTCGR